MVLHFLIQGRVQGVGFAGLCIASASELDLRGWVRNTEDGDVEVVATGTPRTWPNCVRASSRARGEAAWIAWLNTRSGERSRSCSAFRIEGAW